MHDLHPKVKELKTRAMPINYSSLGIDSKGELVDDLTGKAYLCVWGTRDTYGTVWMKGSWAKSIRERGPESTANQKIAFCWQHDLTDPIGRFTKLVEDDYGVYSEFVFDNPDDVPSAKRAISQIRSGTINGYSFGFDFVWDKMKYDEKTDNVLVYEADIMEGSPVTLPSIKETYTVRSEKQWNEEKELLHDYTEDFIKSIPRKHQLELRQLITRHISLAKAEPLELRQIALEQREPVEAALDFEYILQNLKF
jgi:HK97 family phage prohead protease